MFNKIKSWFTKKEKEEVQEPVETPSQEPIEAPQEAESKNIGECAYCNEEIKEDHPKNRFKGNDYHKVCWKQIKKEAKGVLGQ